MNDEILILYCSLADRLCERKALKPLWRFLSAYFAVNGLSDGWEDSYRCLKSLRALCRDELTRDELKDVDALINKVGQIVTGGEWTRQIEENVTSFLDAQKKRRQDLMP